MLAGKNAAREAEFVKEEPELRCNDNAHGLPLYQDEMKTAALRLENKRLRADGILAAVFKACGLLATKGQQRNIFLPKKISERGWSSVERGQDKVQK